MGGRICVLATPRPAMPNRKTSLTESLSYFSVLSQKFAKEFPASIIQKSPLPLFAKEGNSRLARAGSSSTYVEQILLSLSQRFPLLKKRERGGFGYEFGRSHRLDF